MTIPDEPTPLAPNEAAATPRLRRTAPARQGPVRNPTRVIGVEPRVEPRAAPSLLDNAACAADSAQRVVEAAVQGAYRVFDEYLQWGQKTAEQTKSRAQDWRVPVGPKPLDMQNAATQWLQMWQEMYRLWLSAFGQFMPNPSMPTPFMPNFWGTPFAPEGFGATPFGARPMPDHESAPVDVVLEASQPVRLSVRLLQPTSIGTAQAVLHRQEGEGKLSLSFDGSGARLTVPAGQPVGTYSGVLHDSQGMQRGMVTVHVLAAAAGDR